MSEPKTKDLSHFLRECLEYLDDRFLSTAKLFLMAADRLEKQEGELHRLREEARRFYLPDGSFTLLDSAEEVVKRRVESAKRLGDLMVETGRWEPD